MKMGIGANLGAVAKGEVANVFWQFVGGGVTGLADEKGNDGDVALKGGEDFDADVVTFVGKALLAVFVASAEPGIANQDDDDGTLVDDLIDVDAEIDAEGDVVDILEDLFAAKMGDEPVVEATGDVAGIAAAIAEEQLRGTHAGGW
jgi:hypothetical protein